jgi:hypothetical protein
MTYIAPPAPSELAPETRGQLAAFADAHGAALFAVSAGITQIRRSRLSAERRLSPVKG